MKHQAFVAEALYQDGMGMVLVVRNKSQGRYEAGAFLLDTYCLGVKDAFYTDYRKIETTAELLEKIFPSGDYKEVTAACGRKLVERAVTYAQSLGFAPAKDYKMAARVFGGISPDSCSEDFTFGYEGKPMYIQGPNDSQVKADRISMALERKLGKGNFHFTLAVGGFDADPFED